MDTSTSRTTDIFKLKLLIIIGILGILCLASGACTQSPEQVLTATPKEIPTEGIPGEYIDVIIQVSNVQPCRLVLATPHKTEVENYLAPYTSDTLTFPSNDGEVIFHERIPAGTPPGNYILKVMQMVDGDAEGTEIFSQTFIVR